MSETTAEASELTSQYSAQVAGDLERNLKEQERVSDEIEALQAQLTALQRDHTVLVSIQQALGAAAPATPADEPTAAVPAPRKQAPDSAEQTEVSKDEASRRKRAGRRSGAQGTTATSTSPTLVELVRDHLASQNEPRSAAEITTALGQRHPERNVKTTVVRSTLEGLVARNKAERTKQGKSVYYTTTDAAEPAASAQESLQQSH
ncbi:hypothetical protein ACFZAV_27510 [Streptomyces sp. NPDC008343]|uniref:hypothetical protein n=1 Tax=Streptomyces sp. NPDC008343 TaxID=3364828 RepID=UPI0036EE29C3